MTEEAALYGRSAGDRLERVGDEDDARLERDLVASESVGVAASVDVLVVMEHPARFLVELGGLDDGITDVNVSAHRGGLVGVQRSGLAKDPVRDADLPDVVQQTGQPDPLEPIGVEAELLADQHTQLRDGLAVVPCSLVLRVDRAGERRGQEPLVVAVRALLGRRRRLRRETVGVDDDPASGPLRLVEREVDVAKERLGPSTPVDSAIPQVNVTPVRWLSASR